MRTYHWISPLHVIWTVSKLAYRIWVILIANKKKESDKKLFVLYEHFWPSTNPSWYSLLTTGTTNQGSSVGGFFSGLRSSLCPIVIQEGSVPRAGNCIHLYLVSVWIMTDLLHRSQWRRHLNGLARLNTVVMASNPTAGMDVYPRFPCVFLFPIRQR
jgi:hypothetical protein